jgi:hypothetical protein
MTSSKSSSPPADPYLGFEQFHHHRHIYSMPPQLTLVDALAMQSQARTSTSFGGSTTMPLCTGGDALRSVSDEIEALDLEAMMGVLDRDIVPSGRNQNTRDGRGSEDSPPRESSAQ